MHEDRRHGLAPVLAALALPMLVASVTASANARAATQPVGPQAVQPHRSVHLVDIDGDGTKDRIVMHADKGFSYNTGTGHYTVRARLSSTGRTTSKRLLMQNYTGGMGRSWSAWFGASQLDHVSGAETLVGEGSGASSESFYALTLRNGRLRLLDSPQYKGDKTWQANSDSEHQSGYRCTTRGVQLRGVGALGRRGRRWEVRRDSYLRHGKRWRRLRHVDHHVHTHGGQPRSTRHYGSFHCHGLPAMQL